MKTAIVTDTNSNLSIQEADQLRVHLISMPFCIDGDTYLEGKDCTPEMFFRKMKAGANVSTSQPSPEEITSLWESLLKTHDAVLHFPMTSGLSGSCETAKALADQVVQELENNENISSTPGGRPPNCSHPGPVHSQRQGSAGPGQDGGRGSGYFRAGEESLQHLPCRKHPGISQKKRARYRRRGRYGVHFAH